MGEIEVGVRKRQYSNPGKLHRLVIANKFIKIISRHGRRFFYSKTTRYTAQFEIDWKTGHIYFRDSYNMKKIYTHYRGRWLQFSQGGTMRNLVIDLSEYIQGKRSLPLHHLGPWNTEYISDGDLWGYGNSMEDVRKECAKLVEKTNG
jgi:hypothetical protein